jgi:RimJ/RimL family protein N-acetyltransferase
MSGLSLETARFELRELTLADATERYLSWLSDDQARKYITAAAATKGLADLRDYIGERIGREDVLFLGIFDRDTHAHIGNIKYEPIDAAQRCATMGILIGDPAYRGRGVTPEVLEASARWLQSRRGIEQILLGVDRENVGAIRAYEKVGFVLEESPLLRKDSAESLCMVWRM